MGANVLRTDPRTGQQRTYYKADDGKLYADYSAAVAAQGGQRMAGSGGFRQALGNLWSQADRAVGGWLPGGGTGNPLSGAFSRESRGAVGDAKRAIVGGIVRSAPVQAVRDAALDASGLPKPEQFFIRAMTGGSRDITTMTPQELSLVKGAYEQQRKGPGPLDDATIAKATAFAQEQHAVMQQMMKGKYDGAPNSVKSSDLGKAVLAQSTMPFDPELFAKGMKAGHEKAAAHAATGLTSLYGQGRDMKMAYGTLTVKPQPDGGVEIYDRWKVDKADKVAPGAPGMKDRVDFSADLMEGGPVPSLIYSAAKRLGTYQPFDIRVQVPGKDWNAVKGTVGDDREVMSNPREDQGGALQTVNNAYMKVVYDKNLQPRVNR